MSNASQLIYCVEKRNTYSASEMIATESRFFVNMTLKSDNVRLGLCTCVECPTRSTMLSSSAAVQRHGSEDHWAAFKRLSQQRYLAPAAAMRQRLLGRTRHVSDTLPVVIKWML